MCFDKILPIRKFALGTKERQVKTEILGERFSRLIIYSLAAFFGFYLLAQSDYLSTGLLGSSTDPQFFANYPCQVLPPFLDDFYIVKFAYHFYECLNASLFHRNRRDFSEHFFHHLLTIVLISYSYFTNVIPIGAVIMLVMDFSDIFVCIFKMTVDVSDALQFPAFLGMLFSWIYLRMWHFPMYLIKEIWFQAQATGHPV